MRTVLMYMLEFLAKERHGIAYPLVYLGILVLFAGDDIFFKVLGNLLLVLGVFLLAAKAVPFTVKAIKEVQEKKES